jgi:hypothetical protein
VLGLVLSINGLTVLVHGIIHAGDTSSWVAASVLAPIVMGLLILTLFVWREHRSDHESFDVSLFINRGFSFSLATVSLSRPFQGPLLDAHPYGGQPAPTDTDQGIPAPAEDVNSEPSSRGASDRGSGRRRDCWVRT